LAKSAAINYEEQNEYYRQNIEMVRKHKKVL